VATPRFALSPEARADLRQIENYIAVCDGEARASAFRRRLDKSMRMLAFMHGIGRQRSYLKPGQRAFPVPPWMIYYATLPGDDGIEIVRVIDGRRDLSAIFTQP
jgi:toxin ParE1/3/4